MRKNPFRLSSVLALVSILAAHGCSSGSGGGEGGGGGSSSGSAGTSGSAGSSGSVPNCPSGSSCGGDLVGTWEVTSSCLAISGDMDTSMGSIGCKNLPVSGSVQVTGTWTVKADGSYKDNTTVKGSMSFTLESSCLSVSSVPVECKNMGAAFTTLGWNNTTCSEVGGKCACKAETNRLGGLGVPSIYGEESGGYEVSGGDLTLDQQVNYSFCVEGSKLTVSPKPTFFPIRGTIVLQKSATPTGGSGGGGAGGSSPAGGSSVGGGKGGSAGGGSSATAGKGGSAGAGGSSVTGGKGGSAGASTVTGGSTGSGGQAGSGGTSTVAGGTTSAGGTSTGGTTGTGGSSGDKPCDIYQAANFPCAAAHSTIRALFSSYSGKLYQVRRASDKTFLDIGTLSAGGMADAAAQDTFCKGTTCLITRIYDQTKNGNFLGCQSKDQVLCPDVGSPDTGDSPASATNEALKVGGSNVYALRMNVGNAYWRDGSKSGMPLKDAPQGIYMVTSGVFFNGGCCFDYGNGPTTRKMSGGGTMDSVYFGNSTQWGSGNGSGPWVMADLEGGIFSQGSIGKNNNVPSMTSAYVTAIEKNTGKGKFAIKGADATTGKLKTFYEDKSPYATMDKKGSIILGSGGDCCYSNSNGSKGVFYEGAIVSGYPDDATEDKIQDNIISAGYGK
jgi:non-reducing end alpha-L-arabinofuranosidase